MGCGLVLSESPPDLVNTYVWMKPSTLECFELMNGEWVKVGTLTTLAHAASHESGGGDPIKELKDLHLAGEVYAGKDNDFPGLSDNITITAGGKLKVKKGLVVGWTA